MPIRSKYVANLVGTAAPVVFVFLWSTGFIFSKAGSVYAEPFTFLFIRWAIAAALILLLTWFVNTEWPQQLLSWVHCALVGILVHGVYLGGVFSAIFRGVDAGLTSLIVGLQPLATVLIAGVWLGESLTRQKMGGVLLGLAGICLVIFQRGVSLAGMDPTGILYCFIALLGIVIGTLYQKRHCGNIELLPATFIQFVAACAVSGPMALLYETREVDWTTEFIFIIAWLVLLLSLGAVMLLWWLIRHGDAGRVTTYFYLVPPVVAIQAWFLFGEKQTLLTIAGMALCVAGVWMVQRSQPAA